MKNSPGFLLVVVVILVWSGYANRHRISQLIGRKPSTAKQSNVANGQADVCIANLRKINQAKAQWAKDNNRPPDDIPFWTDVAGAGKSLEIKPTCPSGGTYKLNIVREAPTCSVGKNSPEPHVLPVGR
jgi:hypothetical protein